MSQTKKCTKCGQEKPLTEFYKHKDGHLGRKADCKECAKTYQQKWRKKNPKKHKEYNTKYKPGWNKRRRGHMAEYNERWRLDNPEKHRARNENYRAAREGAPGNGVTAEEWEEIVDRYDGQCLCCGTSKDITMDHVIPLSRGGAHDPSNIQPLCRSCNTSKMTDSIDYRLEYRLARGWNKREVGDKQVGRSEDAVLD